MSNSILKPTKCSNYCSFENTSSYCSDCPALMCDKCCNLMHTPKSSHKIINFKNISLKWDDKTLITSIFEDKNLGEKIYTETSRKINMNEINILRIFEEEKPNEDPNEVKWKCEKCTYSNNMTAKRCEMCYNFRILEDCYMDYNKKLDTFQKSMLKNFIELDNIQETNVQIPFENVMYCFTHGRAENLSLPNWYRQYYPNRKSISVINNIIDEKGFRLSTNELDRQYNAIIKEKNMKILQPIGNKEILDKLLKSTSELLDPIDVNRYNKVPDNFNSKKVSQNDLWDVIKGEMYTNRQIRMLMSELEIYSQPKIDMLRTCINNTDLRDFLKSSIPNGNIKLLHLKQAISEQVTIDGVINFLQKPCELCCGEYPIPEMLGLITCQHELCKGCALEWLKETIETKYPCKWNCPFCSDEQFLEIDKNLHYSQLRGILSMDKKLLNVFEEKLLQEQLMKSPNFHWCANEECTNGFEAEGVNKIQCPSCNQYMCVDCNRNWQKEHEGKTCQEFELWMLKNDPNLSKLLRNIGIECPGCGMRYALAAGGCLHFDCKACGIKFCGGCDQLFVDKCDKPACSMTNFHGHHPRNCLYFLRDYGANELEKMLKDSDYPKLQGKPEKQCQFMVTTDKLKDVPCNKEVYSTTAMCEPHYKEYLVQFINRYKIDPVEYADAHSLNLMLFQMVIPQLTKIQNENDNQFKERLKKTVKENCLFYIPKGVVEVEPKVV